MPTRTSPDRGTGGQLGCPLLPRQIQGLLPGRGDGDDFRIAEAVLGGLEGVREEKLDTCVAESPGVVAAEEPELGNDQGGGVAAGAEVAVDDGAEVSLDGKVGLRVAVNHVLGVDELDYGGYWTCGDKVDFKVGGFQHCGVWGVGCGVFGVAERSRR